MNLALFGFGLCIAGLDWIALARKNKPLEYIAKPGALILLIIWFWQTTRFENGTVWFGLGLIFSLAGDIFLMLPREQFIPGLISFLLGHLAYLVGFNQQLPPLEFASLILAAFVTATGYFIYRAIYAGLRSKGKTRLAFPVLLYSIVISLMLISALLTLVRPDETWQPGPSLLVSLGAFLFFLSDTLLAWNKFVEALPGGRTLVHITYHLGQYTMMLGVALNLMIIQA
jgi:uncharacterized membrane protein YhhN